MDWRRPQAGGVNASNVQDPSSITPTTTLTPATQLDQSSLLAPPPQPQPTVPSLQSIVVSTTANPTLRPSTQAQPQRIISTARSRPGQTTPQRSIIQQPQRLLSAPQTTGHGLDGTITARQVNDSNTVNNTNNATTGTPNGSHRSAPATLGGLSNLISSNNSSGNNSSFNSGTDGIISTPTTTTTTTVNPTAVSPSRRANNLSSLLSSTPQSHSNAAAINTHNSSTTNSNDSLQAYSSNRIEGSNNNTNSGGLFRTHSQTIQFPLIPPPYNQETHQIPTNSTIELPTNNNNINNNNNNNNGSSTTTHLTPKKPLTRSPRKNSTAPHMTIQTTNSTSSLASNPSSNSSNQITSKNNNHSVDNTWIDPIAREKFQQAVAKALESRAFVYHYQPEEDTSVSSSDEETKPSVKRSSRRAADKRAVKTPPTTPTAMTPTSPDPSQINMTDVSDEDGDMKWLPSWQQLTKQPTKGILKRPKMLYTKPDLNNDIIDDESGLNEDHIAMVNGEFDEYGQLWVDCHPEDYFFPEANVNDITVYNSRLTNWLYLYDQQNNNNSNLNSNSNPVDSNLITPTTSFNKNDASNFIGFKSITTSNNITPPTTLATPQKSTPQPLAFNNHSFDNSISTPQQSPQRSPFHSSQIIATPNRNSQVPALPLNTPQLHAVPKIVTNTKGAISALKIHSFTSLKPQTGSMPIFHMSPSTLVAQEMEAQDDELRSFALPLSVLSSALQNNKQAMNILSNKASSTPALRSNPAPTLTINSPQVKQWLLWNEIETLVKNIKIAQLTSHLFKLQHQFFHAQQLIETALCYPIATSLGNYITIPDMVQQQPGQQELHTESSSSTTSSPQLRPNQPQPIPATPRHSTSLHTSLSLLSTPTKSNSLRSLSVSLPSTATTTTTTTTTTNSSYVSPSHLRRNTMTTTTHLGGIIVQKDLDAQLGMFITKCQNELHDLGSFFDLLSLSQIEFECYFSQFKLSPLIQSPYDYLLRNVQQVYDVHIGLAPTMSIDSVKSISSGVELSISTPTTLMAPLTPKTGSTLTNPPTNPPTAPSTEQSSQLDQMMAKVNAQVVLPSYSDPRTSRVDQSSQLTAISFDFAQLTLHTTTLRSRLSHILSDLVAAQKSYNQGLESNAMNDTAQITNPVVETNTHRDGEKESKEKLSTDNGPSATTPTIKSKLFNLTTSPTKDMGAIDPQVFSDVQEAHRMKNNPGKARTLTSSAIKLSQPLTFGSDVKLSAKNQTKSTPIKASKPVVAKAGSLAAMLTPSKSKSGDSNPPTIPSIPLYPTALVSSSSGTMAQSQLKALRDNRDVILQRFARRVAIVKQKLAENANSITRNEDQVNTWTQSLRALHKFFPGALGEFVDPRDYIKKIEKSAKLALKHRKFTDLQRIEEHRSLIPADPMTPLKPHHSNPFEQFTSCLYGKFASLFDNVSDTDDDNVASIVPHFAATINGPLDLSTSTSPLSADVQSPRDFIDLSTQHPPGLKPFSQQSQGASQGEKTKKRLRFLFADVIVEPAKIVSSSIVNSAHLSSLRAKKELLSTPIRNASRDQTPQTSRRGKLTTAGTLQLPKTPVGKSNRITKGLTGMKDDDNNDDEMLTDYTDEDDDEINDITPPISRSNSSSQIASPFHSTPSLLSRQRYHLQTPVHVPLTLRSSKLPLGAVAPQPPAPNPTPNRTTLSRLDTTNNTTSNNSSVNQLSSARIYAQQGSLSPALLIRLGCPKPPRMKLAGTEFHLDSHVDTDSTSDTEDDFDPISIPLTSTMNDNGDDGDDDQDSITAKRSRRDSINLALGRASNGTPGPTVDNTDDSPSISIITGPPPPRRGRPPKNSSSATKATTPLKPPPPGSCLPSTTNDITTLEYAKYPHFDHGLDSSSELLGIEDENFLLVDDHKAIMVELPLIERSSTLVCSRRSEFCGPQQKRGGVAATRTNGRSLLSGRSLTFTKNLLPSNDPAAENPLLRQAEAEKMRYMENATHCHSSYQKLFKKIVLTKKRAFVNETPSLLSTASTKSYTPSQSSRLSTPQTQNSQLTLTSPHNFGGPSIPSKSGESEPQQALNQPDNLLHTLLMESHHRGRGPNTAQINGNEIVPCKNQTSSTPLSTPTTTSTTINSSSSSSSHRKLSLLNPVGILSTTSLSSASTQEIAEDTTNDLLVDDSRSISRNQGSATLLNGTNNGQSILSRLNSKRKDQLVPLSTDRESTQSQDSNEMIRTGTLSWFGEISDHDASSPQGSASPPSLLRRRSSRQSSKSPIESSHAQTNPQSAALNNNQQQQPNRLLTDSTPPSTPQMNPSNSRLRPLDPALSAMNSSSQSPNRSGSILMPTTNHHGGSTVGSQNDSISYSSQSSQRESDDVGFKTVTAPKMASTTTRSTRSPMTNLLVSHNDSDQSDNKRLFNTIDLKQQRKSPPLPQPQQQLDSNDSFNRISAINSRFQPLNHSSPRYLPSSTTNLDEAGSSNSDDNVLTPRSSNQLRDNKDNLDSPNTPPQSQQVVPDVINQNPISASTDSQPDQSQKPMTPLRRSNRSISSSLSFIPSTPQSQKRKRASARSSPISSRQSSPLIQSAVPTSLTVIAEDEDNTTHDDQAFSLDEKRQRPSAGISFQDQLATIAPNNPNDQMVQLGTPIRPLVVSTPPTTPKTDQAASVTSKRGLTRRPTK